jgi:PD-(D/E)XK nuclease superfamily
MLPTNVTYDADTNTYILRLDASLYNESDCERLLLYKAIYGLRASQVNYKADYGTAFHKALKVWYGSKTATIEECFLAASMSYMPVVPFVPDGDFRQAGHLLSTISQYLQTYTRTNDLLIPSLYSGSPLLEYNFAWPYIRVEGKNSSPNIELLLCGTIDMKATVCGQHTIVDHKTTAAWNPQEFCDKAYNSAQLMFYTMMFKKFFPDIVDLGAMLNCVFLSRTGKATFKRSDIIVYSSERLQEFEAGLRLKCYQLITGFDLMLKSGNDNCWTPNYTRCDKFIAKCEFFEACRLQSKEAREEVLQDVTEFTSSVYDPLKFQQ